MSTSMAQLMTNTHRSSIAFRTGAELLLPPQFPLPLYPDTIPYNLAFQDDAQIHAWRTVKRFPKNTSFMFDVVVRLHQLGGAVSSEWTDRIDCRALSNLYFEAQQSAILVQLEEPWSEQLQEGLQGQEAAVMFKVWAAGLPIFVDGALRHLRSRHRVHNPYYHHGPVFSRIQAILDSNGGYHAWPRGRNLEPVLATLFYASEACNWQDPWRLWCMDAMRKAVDLLRLKTAKEFRKMLDFFPSTETYQEAIEGTWRELTHEQVPSTPSYLS